MPQLQDISQLPPEPWKNGGGITRTLLHSGAQPAAWRISVAEIQRSGAFSRFENTERLSVLLRGEGLQLICAGQPHTFTRLGQSLRYDGATPTEAVLGIGGPARFLNIMVDPLRAQATVHAQAAVMPTGLGHLDGDAPACLFSLLVPVVGSVQWRTPDSQVGTVDAGHTLRADALEGPVTLQAHSADAQWVVAELFGPPVIPANAAT